MDKFIAGKSTRLLTEVSLFESTRRNALPVTLNTVDRSTYVIPLDSAFSERTGIALSAAGNHAYVVNNDYTMSVITINQPPPSVV